MPSSSGKYVQPNSEQDSEGSRGRSMGAGGIIERVIAGIHGARDVQMNNANVSVVGGDSQTHIHYHGTAHGLRAVLRAITNFRKIQQDTFAKATPGTVSWLLENDIFRLWVDADGRITILWGSGIPGAGKTIVASIVINEIERRAAAAPGTICLAYFYMRYSEHAQMTVRTVLEVLVKQTVERLDHFLPLFEELYDQHIREGTHPTEEQLLELLQQFNKGTTATFYILDALDEAPVNIQLDLVERLASLNAQIFITSRPLQDVQMHFPGAHCFDIFAQEQDINLHIAKRLQSSPRLRTLLAQEDLSYKEQLVSTVKSKCGGMFLHASLQLDALQRCLSLHSIVETLEQFPAKIEDVYRRTWDRIMKQDPEHSAVAKSALAWVLSAKRSITIEELRRALATCPETHRFQRQRLVLQSTITDLCHGLLIVDERSRLVRLVHYSAKRTLENLVLDFLPHPHALLASVCMTHLASCGFQNTTIASQHELEQVLKEDPLLNYAYDAWAFHAQKSFGLDAVATQVKEFILQSHYFPVVLYGACFDWLTPLHMIAFYNLPIAAVELHKPHDANIPTKEKRTTPLNLACCLGHHVAAQCLLVEPNTLVNSADKDGYTALMLASRNGYEAIVELLLARPEIEPNLVNSHGVTALVLASIKGYGGIVKLLMEHPEVRVSLAIRDGWIALMLASRWGYSSIIELLLPHLGASLNFADPDGWSALMLASRWGHHDIVKLLLAHPDVQVNRADNHGDTALMLASRHGHERTVALLLAHPEIEVNRSKGYGMTALILAFSHGHERTAQLLLSHPDIRSKVNSTDEHGNTILMLACAKGYESAVKTLLAHPHIEVNVVGNQRTALICASLGGHTSIVKLLLYPGVEVNLASPHGSTALLIASEEGRTDIIQQLLAAPGIDVNIQDLEGDAAIKLAAERGHEEIVRTLLQVPAINIKALSNRNGHTAMSAAVANGHHGVVRLLQDFERRRCCSSSHSAMPALQIPVAINQEKQSHPDISQFSATVEERGNEDIDLDGDDLTYEADSEGSEFFEDALEYF